MRVEPRVITFVLVLSFLASIPSCKRKPPSLEAVDIIDRRTNVPMVEPISRDLTEIRQRGSLTVVAPYNSTTYFIYQGEPLGYEYELLQAFAKDFGVALKIVVVADPKSLLPALNEGEGDIAAARLIPHQTLKPRQLLQTRSTTRIQFWCNRTKRRLKLARELKKQSSPDPLIRSPRSTLRRAW